MKQAWFIAKAKGVHVGQAAQDRRRRYESCATGPTDWQMTYDGCSISLESSVGSWNFKGSSLFHHSQPNRLGSPLDR